jgi:hypothetical protein
MNQYLDVYSVATFTKIATFQGGLIADTMVFNSADLQTTLNTFVTNTSLTTLLMNYVTNTSLTTSLSNYITASALNTSLSNYVTNTSLTTSLSNYVTNTSLSNLNINTLTFNPSVSVKQLMLFNLNQSNVYDNLCISVEPNMIRYNVNDPNNDCHVFSSANGFSNGFTEILRLKTTTSILNSNLTITGIQNTCRKSITYLNSNFFLTVANITAHYIITNNATIYFNCFAPTQNVTDGYEINIRNAGSGIVTITGCVPIGYNISTQTSTILIQNQSCKIISGHDSWYQI